MFLLAVALEPSSSEPAPAGSWWTWDYPLEELPNVYFEIYHARELLTGPPLASPLEVPAGFTFYMSVLFPPIWLPASEGQEFYIVRAVNTRTGVPSCWNAK